MNQSPGGLNAAQFWLLNLLAALALTLVLISAWLFFANRATQAEVNARQQYLNDTVQLSQLNNQMAQFLANLAVQTGDQGILDLLRRNGIDIEDLPSDDTAGETDATGEAR